MFQQSLFLRKHIMKFLAIILILYLSASANASNSNGMVLVTAATGQIGESMCNFLAADGYNLLVAGRNKNKLAKLQKELQEKYPNVTIKTLIIDFANITTIKNSANKINNSSINGIVLIGPRPSLSKEDIPSPQEWATVFAETFIAPIEVIRYFGPKLNDNSSIVVISGSSSKNYSSSYTNTNIIRLAWSGEIKNLMHFFADRKIRVNSISPGTILTQHHEDRIKAKAISNNISYKAQLSQDTSSIPLKSYGRKEDVANLAIFLLSRKSSHLNGVNILLDGGESNTY